jgi:LPS export ABC transporter permease LptF/LPS export ABC transporter permease LptG
MRIIDRYVIRQVLLPFGIGLLVFTFVFIIPSLIRYAEQFIAKGVPAPVVLELMVTLVPQALALTIPMALLLALLVGFGRLSADREFVAMQACGVSLIRLLRPVGILSLACWAATSYVLIVAVPAGNQTFREITFNIVASSAEGEVKPRVFFQSFPNLLLYVRDVPASGAGWNGVFMADTRPGQAQSVYVARHGLVQINREKKTVQMLLEDGVQHTVTDKGEYRVGQFARQVLTVDPDSVFPRGGIAKGDNEMTIAELRARIAELQKAGTSTHNQQIAIQRKFSIPIACFVFALIGLALGATNRRDGTLGSFVLGLLVVFAYYVPLSLGPAMAKGALIPPWLAAWLPNLVLGAVGIALFLWRDRVADQPIALTLPAFLRRSPAPPVGAVRHTMQHATEGAAWRVPFLSILDQYVATMYLRIFVLSASGLAAIFYISTFVDLSDKVFKGTSTWTMLAQYFWYATPQYIYYILPLAVLLAALVTISVLTRNSELIVMKACGISLYRVAVPMLLCAVIAGGALFLLDQSILGRANREAEAIRFVMRGGTPQTFDVLTRKWLAGNAGTIYNYNSFNPRTAQVDGLQVFEFSPGMTRLVRRTFAEHGEYVAGVTGAAGAWRLDRGWVRQFGEDGMPREYLPFIQTRAPLESAAYFGTETPDSEFMTYTQLLNYTERLKASGFDVLEQQVALARKISFPFVTLIMTLIAVPFAVTTGRSGAMAGIAIGIALAITYWTAISVFAAMGTGGVLAPTLAAWAPNLLFGAGAAYLLLTVRT